MDTTMQNLVLATNEEGYLKNPKEWTEAWAREVAAQHHVELTDLHWAVLRWLRQKHEEGIALNIRKVVANSGLKDIKEFYQLFPGGPLKVASKIAGIPKPVSCI